MGKFRNCARISFCHR